MVCHNNHISFTVEYNY